MTPIISDSPAHSTGTDALWEKPTFEQDVSSQQITDEWIQNLPPELKDAALYRFCKMVEAKPTLVESFTLSQVLYRTISGNTFTESAESVAARTGCDPPQGGSASLSQNNPQGTPPSSFPEHPWREQATRDEQRVFFQTSRRMATRTSP